MPPARGPRPRQNREAWFRSVRGARIGRDTACRVRTYVSVRGAGAGCRRGGCMRAASPGAARQNAASPRADRAGGSIRGIGTRHAVSVRGPYVVRGRMRARRMGRMRWMRAASPEKCQPGRPARGRRCADLSSHFPIHVPTCSRTAIAAAFGYATTTIGAEGPTSSPFASTGTAACSARSKAPRSVCPRSARSPTRTSRRSRTTSITSRWTPSW